MASSLPQIIIAAKACHEANRVYCASIGDNSQVSWEDAPEWQRLSAIQGVEFLIANPKAPESAQYESWVAAKVAEGWKFGAVKDPGTPRTPGHGAL